jgi:hypothetical protein
MREMAAGMAAAPPERTLLGWFTSKFEYNKDPILYNFN